MNVLAFDTSMQACSVAVHAGDPSAPVSIVKYEEIERGHAERLVPMIGEVMGQAGLEFAALDAIAVTLGPGTFTGVRIGIATAKGLALAAGKPVLGETSLRVIAARYLSESAKPPGDATICVAVDARRDQLYVQNFSGPHVTALNEPQLLSMENAARALPLSENMICIGSGAVLLKQAMAHSERTGEGLPISAGSVFPHAGVLAQMVANAAIVENRISPLYLRPPDAKPQSGKSIARRQSGS